jgi:Fe-S oxidoreductase
MCLGCNTPCALGQDVPSWLRAARAEAVARGATPHAVDEIRQRGEAHASPHAKPVDRMVWSAVREALQTEVRGRTDVVYVPSCTALAREPRIVFAVVTVLQAAGVPLRVVHPGCCGGAFADLGLTELAERLGAEMRQAIEAANGRRVVTDGPVCARTLDAIPFAVVADELLRDGALHPRRIAARVAYHDPCTLGRDLGRYDEPRRVLASVVEEIVEFPHAREHTLCCGGGAGLPATHPRASRAMAAERLAEIEEVDMIVSACAGCKRQLGIGDIPVRDLAEVLAVAL